MAAGAIPMGAGEAFICAGVESMTRVPMMGFNPMPNPTLVADYPQAYVWHGRDRRERRRANTRSRASEQEAFAVDQPPQGRRGARRAAGSRTRSCRSSATAAPVEHDGCIRADTTPEALAGLKPAFDEDGTVTAGTSSPLTDGACGAARLHRGLCRQARPRRCWPRIRSIAVAGCAPEIMGIGPVAATRKALARAGLEIGDIDVIELNEAFAVQALACMRELGIDPEKVNLDGGAIALGHPLGATGARITGKAAALLQARGRRYALATQCIGGGQGIATVLEAV